MDSIDENETHGSASWSSTPTMAEELALIQRQVGDLTEIVENKDNEIEELRGSIRTEKSTFLFLDQKLQKIERQLNETQQDEPTKRRRGEKRSLVKDLAEDIDEEIEENEKNESFDDDKPDDESETELAMIAFDEDTFSLMMTNPVFSRDWALALAALSFQWVLLILIILNLLSTSANSSPLNIPYAVPLDVTIGQFLGIFICVGVQTDILSSIRLVAAIWAEEDWAALVGTGNGTRTAFFVRILLPNICKFLSGCMVLSVNFVTIVQSSNIVDLMKDVAALLIISEITEIFYKLAEFGFLGQKLEDHAKVVAETEVQDPLSSKGSFNINYRLLVFCLLVAIMSTAVGAFIVGQQNGSFFKGIYPYCKIAKSEIPKFGNDVCDGGVLNSIACDFDGGDCLNYNLAYPNCEAAAPKLIGNGICDQQYNNRECGYDGADCCPYETNDGVNKIKDPRLNDGMCDGGQYGALKCEYDEGDCQTFREAYTSCNLDKLADLIVGENVPRLGDGLCESSVYNNAQCGFENGDCEVCNSKVYSISFTGNAICNGGFHNTEECNFDAGDCTEFNLNYPRCQIEARSKITENMKTVPIIGDGICNSGLYNNADCGYEDGDCLLCNELIDNITKLGDGVCDGQNYMSTTCGNDGGDCLGCNAPRFEIGNGWCTVEYNVKECGYDGGDCSAFNLYPDCEVSLPSLLGNGYCNGGAYNTLACGFDDGDCLETQNLTIKACNVDQADLLGDGVCQGEPYNTEECDWDKGDCIEFNKAYPDCKVQFPELVGNGWCSGGEYDAESCAWDGGDCE